jgi:protein-S-isoprenylcysteine O-methyltransferase Ste14
MRDINKKKLGYMSFYYFCLAFFAACFSYDFFITESVTGFTFGYAAAFVYMYFRMREAEQWLQDYEDFNGE